MAQHHEGPRARLLPRIEAVGVRQDVELPVDLGEARLRRLGQVGEQGAARRDIGVDPDEAGAGGGASAGTLASIIARRMA